MKTKEILIPALKTSVLFTIGENAQDNSDIISKALPDDIWFHIGDNRSSAHIIATVPINLDRKNKKYIIKQGALLCKQNSKYSGEKHLEIIYARVKHITQTSVPGTVILSESSTIVL